VGFHLKESVLGRGSVEGRRDSDVEAQREAAMDPFVLEQRSSYYTGRELGVPGR
jgi:hypothetical protein